MESEPIWRIELLGGLRLQGRGRAVTRLRTQTTGSLLVFLALHRGRAQPREALAELFWPDRPPGVGRARLREALASLRRQLEPPGVPAGAVLVADRSAAGLDAGRCATDVGDFEAQLDRAARTAGAVDRRRALERALELYVGELVPGLYDDWILAERRRLGERHAWALRALGQLREEARPGDAERRPVRAAPAPARAPAGLAVILLTDLDGAGDAARSFGGATDALASARALIERPADGAPAPRIVLSTADLAAPRSLERVRALLAAARPGQALVTEECVVLLRREDGAVPLADLGVYRVPGAAAPERLFALRRAGTAPQPPARPDLPLAQAGSLPPTVLRFFGRERELGRLDALLEPDRTRLVTITGPGGIGKTRLALEAAGRVQSRYGGAAWFVPLAELRAPALVPGAILDALRLERRAGHDPLEELVAALGRDPALVVLDSFEPVLDGGAELLQELAAALPRTTWLVTSRRALALAFELELPLASLATPAGPEDPEALARIESIALFVDRAQLAKPDFQLTRATAPAIAAICRRLEGIPLAIELAAGRVPAFPPSRILERLDGPEFLVSRRRDAPARHRTLRAAIGWSFDLLAPGLRRFLASLSVFRDGFTIEAAEAICAEPRTLEFLSELSACSLVASDGSRAEPRFRLLESVREYGAEQLSPAEVAVFARRHAEHVLALAEGAAPTLDRAASRAAFDRLAADQENLRAALDWAAAPAGDAELGLRLATALARFWQVRGRAAEGRQRLEALLARSARRTPARQLALAAAGLFAWLLGDFAGARAHHLEDLAIAHELGARAGIAATLGNLGLVAQSRGELDEARALFEQSLAAARSAGEREPAASALVNLGSVALARGDLAAAQRLIAEGAAACRDLDDRLRLAGALHNLGFVSDRLGDHPEAGALAAEALALYREAGDDEGSARELYLLALASFHEGDLAKARRLAEEGVALARRLEGHALLAPSLRVLGRTLAAGGDPRAGPTLEEGLVAAREAADPSTLAAALVALGELSLVEGDLLAARSRFEEAGDLIVRLGPGASSAASLLENLAALLVAEGAPDRAARLLGAASALRAALGSPVPPIDRDARARLATGLRAALGKARLDRCLARGRKLSLDEAIREAGT